MKIVSAIDRIEELKYLVHAGVDELYCGLFTPNVPSHGNSTLNRREGLFANITNYDEATTLIRKSNLFEIPIFFAVNSFYSYRNYTNAVEQISKLIELGADGFIISDISLLKYIREQNYQSKIILSVGGTVFNSETVKFYQKLGVDRITLPRHLLLDEITSITNKKTEFEIIAAKDKCSFIDGFCNFYHFIPGGFSERIIKNKFLSKFILPNFIPDKIQHRFGKASRACSFPYSFDFFDEKVCVSKKEQAILSKISTLIGGGYIFDACGLCCLRELSKANIKYLKISNRGRTTKEKIKNIRFVKSCIKSLSLNIDGEGFKKHIRKLFKKFFGFNCSAKECYFNSNLW